MTVGVLQDIIEKVRECAALGNVDQSTETKILKYINSYYTLDFPQDLRVLKLKDTYTFNTIQGVDTYPFDFDHWSTVEAPAFCQKIQMVLFQNKQDFYRYNFNSQQLETFDSGDGTAGPYSGTTQASPVIRSSNNNPMVDTPVANTSSFPVGYPPSFNASNISREQNILISANTETSSLHVTDDGAGNLIGDCVVGGSIDYATGDISNLTFNQAVPSGNDINIQYTQAVLGTPYTMLFFQEQFVLRPIPDQAYTIELTAYRNPSQALLGTDNVETPNLNGRPELFQWWELIAFGVAKKFYQDRLDLDGVQMMDAFLQEKISEARTTTYGQLGTRSITTIYKDETTNQNMMGYPGW